MSRVPEDIERVAGLGWHVFPASRHSRASAFKGAQEQATTDLDTIARWAKEYPGSNWRLAVGQSGLWGLDVDSPRTHAHDGITAMAALTAKHGALPKAPVTRTGGGGYAVLFRHEGEPIIGKSNGLADGIDPRRGRQSLTLPPSIHVDTKEPYRWIKPPWEVAVPKAPGWLLEALRPVPLPQITRPPIGLGDGSRARNYAVAALRNASARIAGAPSGQANDTLNREAYALAKLIGSVSERELRETLLHAATQDRSMPLPEAVATIDSGLRAGRERRDPLAPVITQGRGMGR